MRFSCKMKTLLPAFLLSLLIGCAGRPEEQIRLAQKAMDEAKEQRAQEFAPSDWASAQEAWTQAQSMLSSEQFGQAGSLFARSKSRFEKARDIAKSKRDLVLKEVQQMQQTIDLRYKTLKSGMESSKISTRLRKSLEDSCKDIDKGIDQVKLELEQGDYVEAKTTAQKTMRTVYEAEKELQK